MRTLCIFLLIQIFACGTANAIVFGPTNFDLFGYPDPKCSEPVVPYVRDEYSVTMFNLEFETYKQCIKAYLDGAKNDRERILEKYNEIIDKYNMFIRSIR